METKFIFDSIVFERAAVFSALVVFVAFGCLGWHYYQSVEDSNQIKIAR